MKEPTRLVHEDPLFARLAAASVEEGPPPAKVDAAVSLARRMVSPWRWLGAGSAVVGASAIALLVMSSVVFENRPPERNREAPPAAAAPVAAPSAVADLAAPPQDVLPVPQSGGAPSDEARPRAIAPRRTAEPRPEARRELPRAPTPAEPSSFDEELELLTAARSGLETKDVAACLRAVERYERRFPSGLFAHEMEVLRIDALAGSGDRVNAHARAEEFLARHPGSPYAPRVRSIAERTKD